MSSIDDLRFMARALELAERGLWTTTPNPRVGCVIVKDGVIVGEGWHERAGSAHAEASALKLAGEKAEAATVYVTLEPCAHFGRTAPCAQALVAARVRRVVAAMRDPNPLVAGKGFEQLCGSGIAVESGVMEAEAAALNAGFVSRFTRERPWVRMKIAASLDGRTALSNGTSQWITGPQARLDGHRWRARACAILTGIGTVRDDDPQLTPRDVGATRLPLRVVVDSRLETPEQARILGAGTLIAAAIEDAHRGDRLRARGAELLVLPNPAGKVDLGALMRALAKRGINEVHVEAGYKLNGSLLREGLVDELLVYVAPRILGDSAQGMFALPELTKLAQSIDFELKDVSKIGEDLRIVARIKR